MTESGLTLLDGATGSNLRKMGMPVGICAEKWALEDSDAALSADARVCQRRQRRHLRADVFSKSNRAWYVRPGRSCKRIQRKTGGAGKTRGGRSRAGRGRYDDDGSPARNGKWRALSRMDRNLAPNRHAHSRVRARICIVLETMLTIEEASAALEAIQETCLLPVMVSFTVSADGRLLFGGSIEEAVSTMEALGADAVGVNCSVGPEQLESTVRAMRSATKLPLIVKPNAGMPRMDQLGQAHYDMTAEAFAEAMEILIARGARLIGGCCGTDPGKAVLALRRFKAAPHRMRRSVAPVGFSSDVNANYKGLPAGNLHAADGGKEIARRVAELCGDALRSMPRKVDKRRANRYNIVKPMMKRSSARQRAQREPQTVGLRRRVRVVNGLRRAARKQSSVSTGTAPVIRAARIARARAPLGG